MADIQDAAVIVILAKLQADTLEPDEVLLLLQDAPVGDNKKLEHMALIRVFGGVRWATVPAWVSN